MKKILFLVVLLVAATFSFAQTVTQDQDPKNGVIVASQFGITRPIREIFAENPVDENKPYREKYSGDRKMRPAQQFPNKAEDDPKYGNDPALLQKGMGHIAGEGYKVNWTGQTASGFRPYDPSGAAGPNHYVQMINSTTFKVYNKTTGVVQLTGTLGNLWSPATANAGDPIVMYDKAADRWFLAQFGSGNNNIYIAVSTSGDPTGSYYTYTFVSPQFPDYLKFSVWTDGYYMTSNQAQKVFCFERTAMLAGVPTARSVYTSYSPPQGSGFFVPLPGDAADGTLPPAGTPCPIFSYSDNGWGASFSDAVNIYQMTVNWTPATPTGTITSAASLATMAFDASYNASWNDVSQPGTTQKLDGIGGVCMYRAQWKSWGGYNTVVLNWAVRISASQRSIMWCELRQNQSTGTWSIYQQGIYTPDTDTRWMGSMAMDNNGSIGIAYLKSNATNTYPGLYYTGRRTCDPLGTLPVTEQLVVAGTGYQTGTNRVGDYAHTCLDPDGLTFWSTGEYMGGTSGSSAARTRIFSFTIPTCTTDASVSIAVTGGNNPTCPGSTVTFTALPVNGGSSPSYQWQVNGVNVGTNSATYSSSTLTAGQVVTCIMTSNLAGVTNNPATSNSITMSVATPVTPAVSIAITNGTNPTCPNVGVTFTATPTNGGTTPSYQWKVDGVNVGTNSATYSTSTLTNGQVVTCVMTSSVTCTTVASATSNAITMTVNSAVNPTVSVALTSGTNPLCAGSSATFTATASNANSPSYQWKVDGVNVGTNSPTYTTSSLTNGQVVSCTLTSAGSCPVVGTLGTGTTYNGSTSALGAAYPTYYGNGRQQWLILASELTALGFSAGSISSIGFDVGNTTGDPITLNGYTIKMAQTTATALTTTFQTPTFTTVYGPTNYTPVLNSINTHTFTNSFNWNGTSNVIVDICFSNQVIGNAAYVTRRTQLAFNGATYYQADGTGGAGACTQATGTVTTYRPNMVLSSGAGSVAVNSNSITMTVTNSLTPSVSIALSGGSNPACAGSSLTFTATPTNGGSTPAYQWKVNGSNVGTNSSSYTTNSLTNGQVVTCVLTSNASCLSTPTATSNGITVTINPTVAPGVSIALTSGGNPSCEGSSMTFTATATNGGSTPVYQWKVDGANVGTNSSTYTSAALTSGQVVTCVLTSNAACVSPAAATSNGITVNITSSVTPSVTIALTSGSNPSCPGASMTFTATPTNGGSTPAYQWKVNGANVGTNSSTYSTTSLTNGQVVTCVMTSNAACASPTTATSNGITANILASPIPAVSIALTSGSNPSCTGSSLTFTATPTNGGSTPAYQWQVNGSNVGTNSPTYSTTSLTNGQVVSCIMTSNESCVSTSTANSNTITITISSASTWFEDSDGDGYGNASVSTSDCNQPSGYVAQSGDCNDASAAVNPAASEVCGNGVDDDCDTAVDEGCCALQLSATTNNSDCIASANGSIDLVIINGIAPITVSWSNGQTTEDLSGLAPGSYTATVNDGAGCTGQYTAVVGNNASPAPTAPTAINGPNGACRNQTGVVFSCPAVAGATSYTWTLPTGATGSSTTNSITLSFSSTYNTGSLCVRANNACGSSANFCRSVTLWNANPTTPGPITGQNVNVCANTTQTYSIAAVTNASSYLWTAPTNATIIAGQGTTTVTVQFGASYTTGSLIVRSQNCFGNSGNRTLTVYAIPAMPGNITGTANNVCPGSTQTYSVASVAGASSYTWTAPAGATINSGQGSTSVSITFPSTFVSGQVKVKANSSCGSSADRVLNVYKNPAALSAITGQSTNLCGGGTFTYSVSALAGVTSYTWTIPASCTLVSTNSTSMTMTVPANFTTGTVSVVAANSCGGSVSKSLAITANPPTPASITGPTPVCPGQTGLTYTTPQVNAYTYTWTAPTGGSITGGQGTNTAMVTWGTANGNIAVKANNTCGSSANRTLAVTVTTCVDGDNQNAITMMGNGDITIYPNPNDGAFKIQSVSAGEYTLVNELGQVVHVVKLNEFNNYSYDVSGLATGFYFLHGSNASGVVNEKIIVTNR